jgi:hypothetical protein
MCKVTPVTKEMRVNPGRKDCRVFKGLMAIKVRLEFKGGRAHKDPKGPKATKVCLVLKEFKERQALVVDKAQPAHRDRQAYKALQVQPAHKDCKDSLACKAQMVQTVEQFDTELFPQIPWLGVMAISTSTC